MPLFKRSSTRASLRAIPWASHLAVRRLAFYDQDVNEAAEKTVRNETIEIARNLTGMGMPLEQIGRAARLSPEELEKL